jgi:hypothetical protein
VVSEVADPDISSIQAAQFVPTVPPFPQEKRRPVPLFIYPASELVSSALFTLLAGI